jgi:nitrate reductase delta subunit
MAQSANNDLTILAQALRYPVPNMPGKLKAGAQEIVNGAVRKDFQKFIKTIQRLSFGEWEELYTRTFDLSPVVAPYIGYQIWGDGYPRGNFMSVLNRAYRSIGMQNEGELPDHLSNVLRYLGSGASPLSELTEVLHTGLQKMLETFSKTDPENPYIYVLVAVIRAVELNAAETASN